MIAKTKTKTKRRLIPAAEYVRMSSGKQERSPAQQRAEIKKLAAREGCKITRRFVDEGITGDSGPEQRPDFKAMLEAAERGEFEILLLENIDRLGRFDSLAGAEYYNRLRRAGVKIITCADGPIDLDSFEGRLVQTVKQEGKHAFLKDLSRKVLRGQMANAKAGNWNGGPAPYAMDRVLCDESGKIVRRLKPGELVRAPGHRVRLTASRDGSKVKAVQYAFDRFANSDIGYRGLAYEMDEKGYPSPGSNGWTHCNLRRILGNRAYVGAMAWGLTTSARYHTCLGGEITPVSGGGRYQNKPAEDATVIEGTHEEIVGRKLFEQVQRKVARRRKRHRTPDEYPLSGLIYCEHCGQPMHGSTTRRKNRQGKLIYSYSLYVCSTYSGNSRHNSTCGHFTVNAHLVSGWLIKALQRVFLGPGRDALVKEIGKQLRASMKSGGDDTGRLRKRLDELDRQRGRLVKAIRTLDDDGLIKELADVRSEHDRVKTELERAQRFCAPADINAEAEAIADSTRELGETLGSADPAIVRELLQRVVSRIVCRWDREKKGGRTWCRLVGGRVELRNSDLFACLLGGGAVACPNAPQPNKQRVLTFVAADLEAA